MTTARSRSKPAPLTADVAAATAAVPRRVFGANDRLGIAVIGVNGMGHVHVKTLAGRGDVRIVALCDVDQGALALAAKTVKIDGIDMSSAYENGVSYVRVTWTFLYEPDGWNPTRILDQGTYYLNGAGAKIPFMDDHAASVTHKDGGGGTVVVGIELFDCKSIWLQGGDHISDTGMNLRDAISKCAPFLAADDAGLH